VPKTSAAKMSLLIFIAESHDMHPNGVPCSKRRACVLLVILNEVKNPVKSWKTNLGVPLPSGKVGLYRKAARAHLWHTRAALATALRQNSIEKGPCGSTSSPTLCRRAATPWSLSLTQFICKKYHENKPLDVFLILYAIYSQRFFVLPF